MNVVGGANTLWCHPGLVVLGIIGKQVEQASKQHSSLASASAPASIFLPWLPSLMDC